LMMLRSGDAEIAEQLCSAALQQFPADANLLCLSALALMQINALDLAESRASAAVKLYPDFPKAHEILGDLFLGQNEAGKAVKSFRRATELEPGKANTYVKLGIALLKSGQTEEAERAIDKSLQLDPQYDLLARAAAFEQSGNPESAEKIYRQILTENPDNVEALRLLAAIASAKTYYGDAEIFLKRAVEKAPDFVRAWVDLVVIQLELDEHHQAVASSKRLVKLDRRSARSRLLLASAYSAVGAYDQAIENYEEALKIVPGHASALLGLGNMLKTIGRHEDAIAAYRTCIQKNPTFAEAYWSLANLKTFRFEDTEVTEMRALLEGSKLPSESIVQLCNALGLEYESRGDYDRAFSYFARGNSFRRKTERYDPVETEDLVDRLIDHFNEEYVAQHSACGDPDRSPIFVVGMPRSGSTLIEQILASHSEVEGTHELSNLGRIVQNVSKNLQMRVRYPESLLHLDAAGLTELGALYIKSTRKYRGGRMHFIDKNPNNFMHIGLLRLILPNARIIDARRHPLDSCLGTYKQLFSRGQPFSYDLIEVAEYYRQYQRLMRHWDEVLPGKVLHVDYEKVVSDLEQQVRLILEHCGLSWEASCLQFHETDRAIRTASSEQVRKPVYSTSINLWRNYEPHLGQLIEILEPELKALAVQDQPALLRRPA